MSLVFAAAEEIDKVINEIQDVAAQQTYLALNATIEAARAGKGFSVVASEVKELAKQSATATENIRLKIQSIQHLTAATVKAIGEVTSAITDVTQTACGIASAIEAKCCNQGDRPQRSC